MDDDVRIIAFEGAAPLKSATVVLVALAIVWLLRTPRRQMILPFILVASIVPYGQEIHLGIELYMMRIMVLCGLVRAVSQGMFRTLRLTPFDKLYLCWSVVTSLAPMIAGREGPTQTAAFLLDNAVEYLVIRCIVTGPEVLKPMVRMLVFLSVIIAVGMLVERETQENYFYIFGSSMTDMVRDGELRATAGFVHPILAGAFGAIVFPLTFLFYKGGVRDKRVWIVGMIASTLVVVCSKSSGPLYGFVSGIFALALWPIRQHVRTLRNWLWATLFFLQFTMTAPVYSLIFKIPDALHLVSGSTSFHRYELIHLAFAHFWEWCFLGISLDAVAHWEWGMQDITNQYLFYGYEGGLLSLVLFVMILVKCFSMIGRCIHEPALDADRKWMAWVAGSLMYVQVMCFFGVSYFSGFWFFLQLSFAIVASCCDPERAVLEAAQAHKIPAAESIHSSPASPRPA